MSNSAFRRAGAALLKIWERTGDPAAEADKVIVYSKDVTGASQLFARISSGPIYQLTPTSQIAGVVVTNAMSPYNVLATDDYLFVNTSAGAVTLNLPNPALFSATSPKVFHVVDTNGTFATNNCTLARFAAEQIEGLAASKVLQTAWGGWTLVVNGTDWFLF